MSRAREDQRRPERSYSSYPIVIYATMFHALAVYAPQPSCKVHPRHFRIFECLLSIAPRNVDVRPGDGLAEGGWFSPDAGACFSERGWERVDDGRTAAGDRQLEMKLTIYGRDLPSPADRPTLHLT